MKKLAVEIYMLVLKSIKEKIPMDACVGDIELMLKGFDDIVKKPVLVLDEKGESERQ